MNPILREFHDDLVKLESLLTFIDKSSDFPRIEHPIEQCQNKTAYSFISSFQEIAKQAHPHLLILRGTIVLYLCGRFERFVRDIFEDLCSAVVEHSKTADNIPRNILH